MSKIEVTVTNALNGARLDKAVIALVEGASRARVKKAIEEGLVSVNGRIVQKGSVVTEGDRILVAEATFGSGEAPAHPEPEARLDVRFESKLVLVVDKPAGQPTAPLRAGEKGTLANALVGHYPELANIGYSPLEPGLVHRLDTETSGLVVVARTKEAFEALREALQTERIQKEYLLACASTNLPDFGTIEYPITNHPKDSRRVYPCIHPRDVMRYAPRPATTTYRIEERAGSGTWALVRAEASRAVRHQIRAHFASIEHPLAGDTLYGGAPVEGLTRHALHAARVAFDGGNSPELAFDVASRLPSDMAALLAGASQHSAT